MTDTIIELYAVAGGSPSHYCCNPNNLIWTPRGTIEEVRCQVTGGPTDCSRAERLRLIRTPDRDVEVDTSADDLRWAYLLRPHGEVVLNREIVGDSLLFDSTFDEFY